MTDSEFIDALGGTTAVAKRFGLLPSAVSMWRARGIPKSHWYEASVAAQTENIDWTPQAANGEAA